MKKTILKGLSISITFIIILSLFHPVSGNSILIQNNIRGTDWLWRQPPYIISIVSGYPYVIPWSEIVAWAGNNYSVLLTDTLDDSNDSGLPKNMYRSVDDGLTWNHVGFDFFDYKLQTIMVHPEDPNMVFTGNSMGMFRSTDAGLTWEHVLTGRLIYDIEVDPNNPKRLYSATCCWGGVYRSDDNGLSWQFISDQALEDIEVNPNFSNIIYGVRGFSTTLEEGFYRSDDYGITWQQVFSGAQSNLIIDPNNPDRMYGYAYQYNSIWRTDDGGENWANISTGLPQDICPPLIYAAAIDPRDSSIWVGTHYHGIQVSYDFGNTWTPVNDGIPFVNQGIDGPKCTSLAISPNGVMAASCTGRLHIRYTHFAMFLPLIAR